MDTPSANLKRDENSFRGWLSAVIYQNMGADAKLTGNNRALCLNSPNYFAI